MSEHSLFETEPEPEETAEPPRTNGLARASLILGLLGFIVVSLVLGLILGIVALVQIGRTGERGRSLAIGGIVASLVWAILLPVGLFVGLALLRSSNAPIADMETGTCYTVAAPGRDAAKVSCTSTHDGEVLDAFSMAGPQQAYPGAAKVQSSVQSVCEQRVTDNFGLDLTKSEFKVVGFAPDEAGWKAGKRLGVCGIHLRDGHLTRPLH